MSTQPLALDLFCCAGGATRGLQQAGFRVIGVDNKLRPRYCGDGFIPGDALEVLARFIGNRMVTFGERVKLINAGPPCQKGSALTIGTNASRGWGGQADTVQLIPELRELLERTGVPYIIEQPVGNAPIRRDVRLCMDMFPVDPPRVWRHRWFELGGWSVEQPQHSKHVGRVRGWRHGERFDGDYVAAYGNGGGKATVAEMQHALGIDWTDVREELTEAIPPAYYRWLGEQFLLTSQ